MYEKLYLEFKTVEEGLPEVCMCELYTSRLFQRFMRTSFKGDRTKWYTDKMVLDKCYGQNGTDKMVAIFFIDFNSIEFSLC